jgi:hypothetical protein
VFAFHINVGSSDCVIMAEELSGSGRLVRMGKGGYAVISAILVLDSSVGQNLTNDVCHGAKRTLTMPHVK